MTMKNIILRVNGGDCSSCQTTWLPGNCPLKEDLSSKKYILGLRGRKRLKKSYEKYWLPEKEKKATIFLSMHQYFLKMEKLKNDDLSSGKYILGLHTQRILNINAIFHRDFLRWKTLKNYD